jgi:hypothetical protein
LKLTSAHYEEGKALSEMIEAISAESTWEEEEEVYSAALTLYCRVKE